MCKWLRYKNFWLLILRGFNFRFIPAEKPCLKGGLQLGWFFIGWQRLDKRGKE